MEEIRFIHRRFLSRSLLFPLIIPLRAIVPLPLPLSLLNWLLPFRKANADRSRGPISPRAPLSTDESRRNSPDRRHVPDQRALTRVANVIDNPLRHRVCVALTMSTMRPFLSHCTIFVREKYTAVTTQTRRDILIKYPCAPIW